MKGVCSVLALTLLVVANALAQPPAPTVEIACAVNYEFVQSYARAGKNTPALRPEGDYFAGNGFFITRRSIDLYPEKVVSPDAYKVTVDAAMHAFLSKACAEDIGTLLSYINMHEFAAMQNVFYMGEKVVPLPARAIERRVGNWNFASWNNEVDRRVD